MPLQASVHPTTNARNDSAKSTSYYKPRYYDIAMFGVTTVLGGQFYGWTVSFEYGFGTVAITQLLMGLAYICYILCAAEIVSTIGFSGGTYGLARAVLGFYPGYLVGCIEYIEYVSFTAAAFLFVAEELSNDIEFVEILIWFIQFLICYIVFVQKGATLWVILFVLFLVCVVPMTMFCLGSLSEANFLEYASVHASPVASDPSNWFVGSFGSGMMVVIPFTTWAYAGVESMALMSFACEKPRVDVPWGMLFSTLILFCFNMFNMFCVASLPPGILDTAADDEPMNIEYQKLFKITEYGGDWLVAPAVFLMGLGFILPSSKLLQSMADSNLVPSWLMLHKQILLNRAIIVTCLFGMCFCVLSFFVPDFEKALANISILSGFITYCCQIFGYICIRIQYKQLRPEFSSPFGVMGALYALMVFTVGIISVAGFQHDHGIAVLSLLAFIILLSLYYHFSARYHEKLSSEEFKFRVLKFNMRAGKKAVRRHAEISWWVREAANIWDFFVLFLCYSVRHSFVGRSFPAVDRYVHKLAEDTDFSPADAADEDEDVGDYDFAVPAVWGAVDGTNSALHGAITVALSSKGMPKLSEDDGEFQDLQLQGVSSKGFAVSYGDDAFQDFEAEPAPDPTS